MAPRRPLLTIVWPGICAGLVAVGLAGCGFEPLYGERAGVPEIAADLATVEVAPIDDRLGLELYNHLRDRLVPAGQPRRPRFLLAVELGTSSNARITEKDSQIRRFDLRLIAQYRLYDVATNEVVHGGTSRVVAAYNVVESASFATRIAEQDAARKAAREVSDEIVTLLALYFERRRGG